MAGLPVTHRVDFSWTHREPNGCPSVRPYVRPSVYIAMLIGWLLLGAVTLKTENYKFPCSFNLQNLKILFWKPLINLAIFLDIMLCQSWCVKAKISYVWTSFPARCRFKHCSKDEDRRTQIAFSKLDNFFVEFVATQKLLITASWVTEDLLTNLGKVGNQGSSTLSVKFIGLCFERQQWKYFKVLKTWCRFKNYSQDEGDSGKHFQSWRTFYLNS